MIQEKLDVGVIGVGSMGYHHARVYKELIVTRLVGVTDIDHDRAKEVAAEYDTAVRSRDELLDAADAVSIAVPTAFHEEIAREAIDRGVHVLVEKPFVDDIERGWDLVDRAAEAGVIVQVGHIERFNPAVSVLRDVLTDQEIIAVNARRLGPPPDREISDSSVMDLMIHDIDVLLSIVDSNIATVQASRARNSSCVTALITFENGISGSLTASRITQQKVRKLSITAQESQINLDYISQSIQIHRQSVPEYVVSNGDLRYRQQSIIERPTVSNGEPLKKELSSFAEAIRSGTEPVVTPEDGIHAIEVARRIEERANAVQPKAVALEHP